MRSRLSLVEIAVLSAVNTNEVTRKCSFCPLGGCHFIMILGRVEIYCSMGRDPRRCMKIQSNMNEELCSHSCPQSKSHTTAYSTEHVHLPLFNIAFVCVCCSYRGTYGREMCNNLFFSLTQNVWNDCEWCGDERIFNEGLTTILSCIPTRRKLM